MNRMPNERLPVAAYKYRPTERKEGRKTMKDQGRDGCRNRFMKPNPWKRKRRRKKRI